MGCNAELDKKMGFAMLGESNMSVLLQKFQLVFFLHELSFFSQEGIFSPLPFLRSKPGE